MSAPIGNQFWKLRTKHGRNKIFGKPKILFQAAEEYFEWCDANPWVKIEQVKSPAKPVRDEEGNWQFPQNSFEVPTARPYTLSGLCLYLGVGTTYFNDFKKTCGEDFSEVITRIEEIIKTQKFEGAAVGAFNANIIARDLGLVDKKDLTTGGDKFKNDIDYSKLSDSALEEIAALESHKGESGIM